MGAVASLMWLALAPGLQIEMLRILHLSALSALYGVVAWAVAIPLAHKLRSYSEMEVLAKSLAIEAVISIQSSDRPHIVEHKLSVFLPPAQRPSRDRQPVASTPAPAPIPEVAFVEEVNRLAADLGPAEFVFADITKLTDREIQILLREVDQQALVVALVGATAEIREKLTGNMSERVRVFILSETGYVADIVIGAEKVAGIHGAICNQVVRMSKQGQISLP
jgi:flagellar motor switch protein FliG